MMNRTLAFVVFTVMCFNVVSSAIKNNHGSSLRELLDRHKRIVEGRRAADQIAESSFQNAQSYAVDNNTITQLEDDVEMSSEELNSDCPNCVDENSTSAASRWTMPLLKYGEKRYYLGIFFKANYFRATQYCRFHGMHLASINSQEENDKLEKYIKDFGEHHPALYNATHKSPKGLGHEHFWTSGTDLAQEGMFFWMSTGRPITFTNWNAGEPNNFQYENGEEENCMELWNRDGKGLKWNDSPCSFETFFVCEAHD